MELNIEDLKRLDNLKSKSLFYPSAGNDILEVLDLFVPHLKEFHFVDMLDDMHYGEDHYGKFPFINVRRRCANRVESERFHSNKRFNFLDKSVVKRYNEISRERYSSGLDQNDRGRVTFTPLHEKEIYGTEFNMNIEVYKYRDDGYSVFRNLIYNEENYRITSEDSSNVYRYGEYGYYGNYLEVEAENQEKFAVFFFRGDSQGGGGSGFYWLSEKYLSEVLNSIEDGGFLVTDGSNYSDHFDRTSRNLDFDQIIKNEEIISYGGFQLIPLGFLRERNDFMPRTIVYQKVRV